MACSKFCSSTPKQKKELIMKELNSRFNFTKESENKLLVTSAIGAIMMIAGIFISPSQTYPHILIAMNYIFGLSLGALTLIAILYASNAGWGAVIKRVPEAMTKGILIGIGLLILVFMGLHNLYEWSHVEVVKNDLLLQKKTWWLNEKYFIIRNIIFVLAWYFFARQITKNSILQDETGEINLTKKNKFLSVVFVIFFAFTGSLASFDWLMSLEPHWYSTIFGLYNLTGILVSSLAAVIIITIYFRRNRVLEDYVTKSHLHDLAKLTFGFATFWMYLFFSQYLLIWYANIPEEVGYLIKRENGSWGIFTVISILFNWVIPFLVLLPRKMKKNEGVLLRVATILLIGRWIDLFWMVIPPFSPTTPQLTIWSFGPMLFSVPLFFWLTFKTFAKSNAIPKKDPMLVESLHYHS